MRRSRFVFWAGMVLAGLGAAGCQSGTHEGAPTSNAPESSSVTLDPANMTRVGTVDERFQSYNVEMIEVTGGKFWKPNGS